MANQHRGEVAARVGDVEVTLRPTFDALVAIETETGETIAGLARRAVGRDIGVRHVFAIVRHAAKAGGTPVTDAQIKAALEGGLAGLIAPAIELVINAVTGGVKPEDAEKNGEAPGGNPPAS